MGIDKIRRLMIGLCIFFAFMALTTGHMIMGGIALMVAFGIKYTFSGSFNERNAYDKQIKDAGDISIQHVYDSIKDIDTPLGRPYIAGHDKFGEEVIVIGPGMFKDYIVIYKDKDSIMMHSSCALQHLKNLDDSRFDVVIDTKGLEVTTKRFSSFVSYKVITCVMLNDIADMIEGIKNGIAPRAGKILEFNMFHYDSSDYIVRDIDDNEYAICRTFFKPLSVTIYDMEGNEVSTVNGDTKKAKEGFKFDISGEEYGTIYRRTSDGHDEFYVDTPDGTFTATAFRAVEDGRVSGNYRVKLDGVDKAIVIGSNSVEFEQYGYVENDVICSFDDDYLVVYLSFLDFIMGINHFRRH